jgi:hypothetical protein
MRSESGVARWTRCIAAAGQSSASGSAWRWRVMQWNRGAGCGGSHFRGLRVVLASFILMEAATHSQSSDFGPHSWCTACT